jgi:uncharacterized membrane protein
MHVMQNEMYSGFINEPTIGVIFLAYFAWTLMAFATKKYIIDNKKFKLIDVFTTAPLLGLVIYVCINISIMTIQPDWTIYMAFADTMFGTTMFAIVALLMLIIKPYTN